MQATQDTTESVLVVGSPGVGKYTLIKRLQAVPDDKTAACTYGLTLDTKYYTADVLLRAVGTQHKPSTSVQALVLVFDASKQSSFESVRSWAERHDTDYIEVKLAVANKSDLLHTITGSVSAAPSTHREQWLEDAMSWCYDCGFEYIEAAAGQPSIDAQLQLDGEQQGVARVLAALQAHMWPCMKQKAWSPGPLSKVSPRLACSAAAGAAAAAAEAGSSLSSSRDQGIPAAAADAVDDAHKAAANGSLAGLQEQEQKQQQGDQQQGDRGQQSPPKLQQGQHSDNSTAACSSSNGSTTAKQKQQQPVPGAAIPDEHLFSEVDVDDFDKLMQQMQGMRARLSGLPDAERRAAAADMTLKLAALMGLNDDEDSEGGSEAAEDDGRQQLDVHSRAT